jgi:hypothetical protein
LIADIITPKPASKEYLFCNSKPASLTGFYLTLSIAASNANLKSSSFHEKIFP